MGPTVSFPPRQPRSALHRTRMPSKHSGRGTRGSGASTIRWWSSASSEGTGRLESVLMIFNPFEYPICWTTPHRLAPTDWADNLPFGMFLVDLLRPRVLGELGTVHGVSY